MKTVKIKEILEIWRNGSYHDKLIAEYTITGNTIDDCFRKVYDYRRISRYDNLRRYDFARRELENQYQEWKKKNETAAMYYGTTTVD